MPPVTAETIVIVEQTGSGKTSRIRFAGRVIVLDPDDRVLLFRVRRRTAERPAPCTPGGGLNDGESYAWRGAAGTGRGDRLD